MARAAPGGGFLRERRRVAAVAAALLVFLAAYAVLLSLSPRASPPAAGARADALLLSILLVAISGAGIAAAARPSDCFALLSMKRRTEASRGVTDHAADSAPFPLVAHHCSCGRFGDHVVHLGDRTWCAGCLGMAAGGACGIGLAVALGAGLLFLDSPAALAAVLAGAAGSAAGLVLLVGGAPAAWHTAANLAFVAGTVLLAAVLSSHGIAAGAFGLLAALALVGLRIEMSRGRHLSIYADCPWQDTCRGASALAAARRATRR